MDSILCYNSRSVQLDLSGSYYSVSFKPLEYSSEEPINTNLAPILKLEDKNIHYRCPNCYNFPVIDFIENYEDTIIYTCACYKGIRIPINDLFEKTNNYMSFLDDNSIASNVIGFKCLKHI